MAEHEHVLREASENYLEAILLLEGENHSVRSVDVANALGVSRPSVNKALNVLRKAGMVEQQPYGSVTLTDAGRTRAAAVLHRHQTLRAFLIDILNVDPDTADEDACRMEHVISEQTMTKLTQHFEDLVCHNKTNNPK